MVHYPLVLPDLITLHPSVGQLCPIRQDLPMFSLLKLAQAHSSAGTPSSSPAFEGNKPAPPPLWQLYCSCSCVCSCVSAQQLAVYVWKCQNFDGSAANEAKLGWSLYMLSTMLTRVLTRDLVTTSIRLRRWVAQNTSLNLNSETSEQLEKLDPAY